MGAPSIPRSLRNGWDSTNPNPPHSTQHKKRVPHVLAFCGRWDTNTLPKCESLAAPISPYASAAATAAFSAFSPAATSAPRCTRRARRPRDSSTARSPAAWASITTPKVYCWPGMSSVVGVLCGDLQKDAGIRSALVILPGGVQKARSETEAGGHAFTIAHIVPQHLDRRLVLGEHGQKGQRRKVVARDAAGQDARAEIRSAYRWAPRPAASPHRPPSRTVQFRPPTAPAAAPAACPSFRTRRSGRGSRSSPPPRRAD